MLLLTPNVCSSHNCTARVVTAGEVRLHTRIHPQTVFSILFSSPFSFSPSFGSLTCRVLYSYYGRGNPVCHGLRSITAQPGDKGGFLLSSPGITRRASQSSQTFPRIWSSRLQPSSITWHDQQMLLDCDTKASFVLFHSTFLRTTLELKQSTYVRQIAHCNSRHNRH